MVSPIGLCNTQPFARETKMNLSNMSMTHRRFGALDFIAFIIGCLSPFYVNVIGRLHIVEIVAPILIFLVWSHNRILKSKPFSTIILFGAAWLLGQVASDLYRNTPMHDVLRGWSSIIAFIILICMLAMVLGQNIRRIYLALFGMALGGLLQPADYIDIKWR